MVDVRGRSAGQVDAKKSAVFLMPVIWTCFCAVSPDTTVNLLSIGLVAWKLGTCFIGWVEAEEDSDVVVLCLTDFAWLVLLGRHDETAQPSRRREKKTTTTMTRHKDRRPPWTGLETLVDLGRAAPYIPPWPPHGDRAKGGDTATRLCLVSHLAIPAAHWLRAAWRLGLES